MRNNYTKHTKFSISINENQRKNLFDLGVGVVVFAIVILTFALNKFTLNKSVLRQIYNAPHPQVKIK